MADPNAPTPVPGTVPAVAYVSPPPNPIQVLTPVLEDKGFWMGVLAPLFAVIAPWLSSKMGLPLNGEQMTVMVAGCFAGGITFIAGHKWSQTRKALASAQYNLSAHAMSMGYPMVARATPVSPAGFIRRRMLMGVAVLSMMLAMGCTWLKQLGTDTLDCAKVDQVQLLNSLGTVIADLAQQNYVGILDAAIPDVQDIYACDAAMLSQSSDGGLATSTDTTVAANAAAYVQHHGKRVVNVPALPSVAGQH